MKNSVRIGLNVLGWLVFAAVTGLFILVISLSWIYESEQGPISMTVVSMETLLPLLAISSLFYYWVRKDAGMVFGSIAFFELLLHRFSVVLYRSMDCLYSIDFWTLLLVIQLAASSVLLVCGCLLLRIKGEHPDAV